MRKLVVLGWIAAVVLAGCGQPAGPGEAPSPETPEAAPAPQEPVAESDSAEVKEILTIGVMPKLMGIDYFEATRRGAEEAALELGVELVYDGPVTNDVQQQVQMIETWIAKGYDAIAVAPNDPAAVAPVLREAREAGIKVLTWDADAAADARDFFVNQCTNEAVAKALMDVMAEDAGQDAKYLILTGSLTADNQNMWMAAMEHYRQEAYPDMANLSETPKVSEENQEMATQVTADCLKAYPDLQGMFAITSVALPGAAEALRKAEASDRVTLTGLATPNVMSEYVKDGTVKRFVMWNVPDLGYLTVQVAVASVKGELTPDATTFTAGRLGEVVILDGEAILGDPIVFTQENVDNYDF